jgi:hemerythrin-like domain-containing protein
MIDAQLLEDLESQHRDAEDLLNRLADASTADEQQPLVDELVSALSQHMQTEETEVYPELEKLDSEMGEEANVEHGLAREGLTKLTEMVGKPGFGAVVEMVKAGISHHVDEEENEAFPKLRKALGLSGGSASASGEATKQELYEQAKEAGIEGRSSMSKEELAAAVEQA